MSQEPKLTPMMQQYFEVKRGLPRDTLLLFRLGDFFEMFFDDAVTRVASLRPHPDQAAGPRRWPASRRTRLDTYVTKLLAAGKKVAICDQTEAREGRQTRQAHAHSHPFARHHARRQPARRQPQPLPRGLALDKAGLHAAWLDLSTGEFRLASDTRVENLLPVLTALDPAELIVAEGALCGVAGRPA
jgi:DNA mismatch repair protein MutS